MAVIKAMESPVLVQFDLADAEAEARQMIEQARTEAEEIRATAAAEARREGYDAGLELGRSAGHEDVAAERAPQFNDALAALENAANHLLAARAQSDENLATDAVTLAAAIARRVTKRQAAIDPAVLESNLREALKLTTERRDIQVAV